MFETIRTLAHFTKKATPRMQIRCGGRYDSLSILESFAKCSQSLHIEYKLRVSPSTTQKSMEAWYHISKGLLLDENKEDKSDSKGEQTYRK